MPILGWRMHFTRRQIQMPRSARPLMASLRPADVPAWLEKEGIDDGMPCLIGPDGTYDVELNRYFLERPAPENTHAAVAYDLANFLTFLWSHREPLGTRGWRDAAPEDRAAYQRWRRSDEHGPGVKGSTWRGKSPRSTGSTGGRSDAASSSTTRSCSVRRGDGSVIRAAIEGAPGGGAARRSS
ncbi:hypothetical protein [Dactylosporangium fulvum]|uniref:Knr4/Smi1-like domain-containing protein n=1 Tax=Dactylosporangium fulvum TaxID=53359 RepID=A0ABY5WAH0_9ACTN|nr:hypothetical protein [Dactylosporangium fulvum]UWP85693.1 hypothetical protein Dfulv_16200 [Dactylosporangium fulvum]